MNVIEPGRIYELNAGVVLPFIRKIGPATICDGTTNEEVLEVLIHRVTEAYQAVPCEETVRALYLLYEALMAFRHRNELRVRAGVEGTNQAHDSEARTTRYVRLQGVLRNRWNHSVKHVEALAQSRYA